MNKATPLFTKSLFNQGLSCPTKLFYSKNEQYANQQEGDSFMEALAKGGFQVGEMSKFKYCNDPYREKITVDTLNYEDALRITNEKLQASTDAVIAEGAFRFGNLFIRADIIVRDGNTIKLIEVKSKSISKDDVFIKKNKPVTSWQPYLYDIAFQTYVLEKALPQFKIRPYLLLINKDAVAHRDGLNQLFKVSKDSKGRTKVVVGENVTAADIGDFDLLREVPLREVIDILNVIPVPNENVPVEHSRLTEFIPWAESLYISKIRHWCKPSMRCKKCTFKKGKSTKKCGFSECWANHEWSELGKLSASQFKEPMVTELWMGLGGASISKNVMLQNVPFISMLKPEALRPASEHGAVRLGMSPFERRKYQIEANKLKTSSYIFYRDDFLTQKSEWNYPYNMIDFETSTVALPYFKGTAPYETVAFQFSHHIMYEDGRVVHHNDFISWKEGEYPNIEFVRALKDSLESNDGSIFRYAAHENTVLNKIKEDIALFKPTDADELLAFINEITQEKIDKSQIRYGWRNMIDMAELVRSFYYSPYAGGSNSIKQILPAIINDCPDVGTRFSDENLYGRLKHYSSRNFDNHTWITEETKRDPYKTLPSLTEFDGIQDIELFDDLGEVADGSAAMTAYNKLQWSFISENERVVLKDALLRYCELDTLAMVMIMQGFIALDSRIYYQINN